MDSLMKMLSISMGPICDTYVEYTEIGLSGIVKNQLKLLVSVFIIVFGSMLCSYIVLAGILNLNFGLKAGANVSLFLIGMLLIAGLFTSRRALIVTYFVVLTVHVFPDKLVKFDIYTSSLGIVSLQVIGHIVLFTVMFKAVSLMLVCNNKGLFKSLVKYREKEQEKQ